MKRSPASLARSVVILAFLLVSLLRAVDTAPAYADDLDDSPVIPSHRVGHMAKSQNLDVILAQSAGADPLSGNYRLAQDDEIMVTYGNADERLIHWQAIDVVDDLEKLSIITDNHLAGYGAASAMGKLSSDNYADAAFLYRMPYSTELAMEVLFFSGGADPSEYSFSTGERENVLPVSVATGDLDRDGTDEIVIGWISSDLWANVEVYDMSMGTHPVLTDKIFDERVLNGNMEITTGDLDGDGDDEIVMGFVAEGNEVGLKVYDVDHKGQITPKAAWAEGFTEYVEVTTGDFNGDGTDEIGLMGEQNLRIFDVSEDLGKFITKSDGIDPNCGENLQLMIPMDVAAGDFNTDGVDELVYACWTQSYLGVYTTAGLAPKLAAHKTLGEYVVGGSLAVGDVNKDLRAEIVLAWNKGVEVWYQPLIFTEQHNYLTVYQVSTDLSSISTKGQEDLGIVPIKSLVSVSLGDINGDSVRVGPPTYQNLNRAVQNIAVINAPPKHKDVIDGITYNVNVDDSGNTYAAYESQQQTSSEMSLTTTRDWSVSAKLESDFPFVKTSLKATYGEGFEKTTSSFKSFTFGQQVIADMDDALVQTVQQIDVWEYPVYKDGSDTIAGHILVTWPRKTDPTCTSNCSADVLTTLDGLSPNARYLPNHVFGNVLSYSTQLPTDIKEVIKSDTSHELGVNPYQMWVEWSDVKDSEEKKSSSMDLIASLDVDAFGEDLSVSGSYAKGDISVHSVGFESDTSIHLYYVGIDGKYRYNVQPVLYWSKIDGHLVLDYAVATVTADPPTWWQNTYDKPDPAFSLPWFTTDPAPGYKLLTRDISFDPHSPTAGDTVTISARVRNLSLAGVSDVKVALYVGHPGDGVQIGTDQNIPNIAPMSSQTVTVQLDTSTYGGETLDIYGVIDPHDAIVEVHDEKSPPNNNVAYALLPVKPQQLTTQPQSLSIQSVGVDYDVNAARHDSSVQISATVKAEGSTFTYVMVEFWDGDPRKGGKFISAEMIPMLLADTQTDLSVDWDTGGLLGAHDVWVNVYPLADIDELAGDNWAIEGVQFDPYFHYLPRVDLSQ